MPTVKQQNNVAFIIFTFPLIVGLLVFVVAPIVWGTIVSLFTARGTIELQEFVGIKNYITLFKDEAFTDSIIRIILYGVFIVPTTVFASLFLAVLITKITAGKSFFRLVFFIPQAASYVVAAMIWRMSIFNGMDFGLVNTVLNWFGIDRVLWVSSLPAVWLPISTIRLWLQVGMFMIIYIPTIENIPVQLYEAARVDGAEREWTLFRHITFPMIRNTTIFVVFMNIINLFKAFDEFYNLLVSSQASNNLYLARTPLIYLYQTGFIGQDYGMGSAGAIIVALLIIIGTRIQIYITGSGKSVRG